MGKHWTYGQPRKPIWMVAASLPGQLRHYGRVRIAFAWASGDFAIENILASWTASGSWGGANKQALIGIRGGLTSPGALGRLIDAGFEVRVPMLTETLDNALLNSSRLFHPKSICFDSGSGPFAFLIGSANLTDQGMGDKSKGNIELASVLLGEPEDIPDNLETFDSWWNMVWGDAEPLTDEALEAYKVARTRINESKDAVVAEIEDIDSPDEIPYGSDDSSTNQPRRMWIELPHVDKEIDPDGARSLSGGSLSQTDIPNEAALSFFNVIPDQYFSEEIELTYGNTTQWKKADYRGDLGLNKQLRLNLITKAKGGTDYRNTVLVMENISYDPIRIDYKIFPMHGPEHKELITESKQLGNLQKTFGRTPRQWGLF